MQNQNTLPSIEDLSAAILAFGSHEDYFLFMETFYQSMASDDLLCHFFMGRDVKATARKQAQFVLKVARLSDEFEGRGPGMAHVNLPPIWEAHFHRRIQLLTENLQKTKLSEAQQSILVRFEEAFKQVVVS